MLRVRIGRSRLRKVTWNGLSAILPLWGTVEGEGAHGVRAWDVTGESGLITTGRSNRCWSGCGSVLGRYASWRAGSDLPVSLSGEVAEARRSRMARSAIARDAVGALDVGGAASDTAQRPLDQCDCFDRLSPPGSVHRGRQAFLAAVLRC